MSSAPFWLGLFRYSRHNTCVELRDDLRDSVISEMDLSIAIAKVYAYLEKNQPTSADLSQFGPDDVIDVLKQCFAAK